MKKGMTLIEVIITIAIIGIVLTSLIALYQLMLTYQRKQHETWMGVRLIENLHAVYLQDISFFDNPDELLYFDVELKQVDEITNTYYMVSFQVYQTDDIYQIMIIYVKTIYDDTLYENIDLGVWRHEA